MSRKKQKLGELPAEWAAANPEIRRITDLKPYARNPMDHPEAQVAEIVASMMEFGWTIPILVDEADEIIAGHGRLEAAIKIGYEEVPVIVARGWSDAQKKAYRIADNRLPAKAQWNDFLRLEMEELRQLDYNIDFTGFTEAEFVSFVATGGAGGGKPAPEQLGNLAERFGVPPFSTLNAREGWWQDRKRAWLALGIQSELGRGGDLLNGLDVDRITGAKETKRRQRSALEGTGLIHKGAAA